MRERFAVALEQLPLWRPGEVEVLGSLGGSPVSDTLLIERHAQRYVVRLDRPLSNRLGLDRHAELMAHRAAAEAGLAPAVEYASPEEGVLITHYVAGRTWQRNDLEEPDRLARLATQLHRLHALRPEVPAFDLRGAFQRYAMQLDSAQAWRLAREGEAMLADTGEREPCLCHNDLVAQNIVQGERLWLIDFEYAALGDPLFDLAVLVAHHDLKDSSRRALLDAYCALSGDAPAALQEPLAVHCRIYRRLSELWDGVTRSS